MTPQFKAAHPYKIELPGRAMLHVRFSNFPCAVATAKFEGRHIFDETLGAWISPRDFSVQHRDVRADEAFMSAGGSFDASTL
jgi:hypothetical protein